jgi:beta-ureidopropionase
MTEAGDDGRYYNSVVLIDPNGTVRGTYRKLRPTVGEMNYGLSPGVEATVWETEYGRVGVAICFDLMFPEVGIGLARNEAELVFFASHLRGNQRIRHWARDYGYHFVKAFPSMAEMVRPTGDVVARNRGLWNGQEPLSELDAGGEVRFAFAELNTDWATFTRIPSNRRAIEEIQVRYPDVIYHDSDGDETFALESRSVDVTVEELIDEFSMITYREYLDWTGQTCLEKNSGSRVGLENFPDVEWP